MRQVLQRLRTGDIAVADVPCPMVKPGHLLIQTTRSLISAGTERSLVEFGRAGLVGKARSQPEKVRQVLDKIKSDGLFPTLEVVFSRLDEPLPLGYCNVGRVVEVGREVRGFTVGDSVVSNGPHAEMVCVPATLAARVPAGVSDEAASFTVLGSVALHGIRLSQPGFGESFVVIGLGLLGLIAVQLLRAHGCHVIGIDVNPDRCRLAEKFGCRTISPVAGVDAVEAVRSLGRGRGADGVLITASSSNDDIIHQAAMMCRKRGRIVLVGAVGLHLQRGDFYEKELSFQVSCSYGPGRYDTAYERNGQDYPLPYVRWTVARNFEAMLDAIARGRVDVKPLISKHIDHARAADAYDTILNDKDVLGVVLAYPDQQPPVDRVIRIPASKSGTTGATQPLVGVIGAGNFTRIILLPALRRTGATVKAVASAGGVSSAHAGKKCEADEATTDYHEILQSPDIAAVLIATPHDTHAAMVADALEAGKHVFVEKPLAIDEEGLECVRQARANHGNLQLMVGFNRRFAPHALEVKKLLAARTEPIAITITVNAGKLPADHQHHDPGVGGGRIVGEGCHFIDLLMFLVGHPITSIQAVMFGPDAAPVREDKMAISMTYADGSIGTVHYLANGPKSYPKERVEVFSEGRVLVIDNWRQLRAHGWPGVPRMKMRQDKGHKAEVAMFIERVAKGGDPLIPFEQLDMVTSATFAAVRSAREGITIKLATA